MRVIGITGGIGTGKSTILQLLEEEYHAYIVETDKLAHKLMEPGENAYKESVEAFGTDILKEDQSINRETLGKIVFSHSEMLERLNEIVHPAVKQHILHDIQKKQQEGKVVYYVIEAALLIEDGYKAICDELWYIFTERETRIERLLKGRGGNREKWEQVIANQSDDDFYRRNCDVVIDNGKSVEQTALVIKDLLS